MIFGARDSSLSTWNFAMPTASGKLEKAHDSP